MSAIFTNSHQVRPANTLLITKRITTVAESGRQTVTSRRRRARDHQRTGRGGPKFYPRWTVEERRYCSSDVIVCIHIRHGVCEQRRERTRATAHAQASIIDGVRTVSRAVALYSRRTDLANSHRQARRNASVPDEDKWPPAHDYGIYIMLGQVGVRADWFLGRAGPVYPKRVYNPIWRLVRGAALDSGPKNIRVSNIVISIFSTKNFA